MSTLQYGLNTTRNSLIAQTKVLDTIAHNVANANTPGYSRQEVQLVSIGDIRRGRNSGGGLLIGAGVNAERVSRSRFALYDEIYRNEIMNLNSFTKTEDLMNQVELLFDEPSERGLGEVINRFFNSWQDVSNVPLDMAARQSLYSTGLEMTDRFHHIFNQLQLMQADIDNEVSALPDRLNEISSEIARLNATIRIAGIQGDAGNDLRDKRDLLVDELSEFVDAQTVEHKDGTMTVIIGNSVVVESNDHATLSAITRSSLKGDTKKTAIVTESGDEFFPTSGKMGALLEFRDVLLPEISNDLNKLTQAIVANVNFEHKDGYGLDGLSERNFFNPNFVNAFNITLSEDVKNVRNIAVSGDGTKGNNENALKISELSKTKTIDRIFSISEFYNGLIASVGILGREAKSGRINQELLVGQIDSAREGIKGVSIDEELIKMIQTQHAYQAASRVVTVIDELLEVVIGLT